MDEDRIGLVLARISELRVEITNCIHKASKKLDDEEVESANGTNPEAEEDDEAVDCLLKIKDALESLEAQVSSLQALQEQQWYEKEAALSEIGYSQEKLLQTLKGYKGKEFRVIHEAIAFVSETVEDNNDLLLPPYPSRPSRAMVSDKGYGAHLPSARKFTQNGVTGSHNHDSRKDLDEANRERSEPKSPLKMVKFFVSAAAKTALTVVGVISVLTLAGFEPQLKKRDNQLKVANLFQQLANREATMFVECPPGKVPVVENGETRCVVKERVEIPFESVVATPDVNYGCG
ncbi:plastid division protein PDV2 [Nicotiana tabacum]|uniref:Plastid division protein PDV2 n=2 Tax=Nicotiana TaxID=4085 RepID=A0A1S3YT65_TOBAC|nr:PREDICTED: plastid division protein PDV2 [Nicotiana sylvestris]XP_016455399.1 PREDICTED: plastid division protein PDV2-like [Nicotiana tabacum]